MTANELRDMLIDFCARNGGRNGDDVIVIPTENESVGPSAAVEVSHAMPGIDWDKGRLFLRTKTPVVLENPITTPLPVLAMQRLAAIRDAHAKCGFEYLPKAHYRAWCDGFKEGVREHYTGSPKDEKEKGTT
jgi:hypothetical protein